MLNKLSESIYYLSNQNDKERPTLGLVCGDKYSLVIDGGNSVQHAKDFLHEIESLNVPPIKYLVITHAHWDHFLGMNEYQAAIIVNSLTNQIINTWRDYSYDDRSLEEYKNSKKMSSLCVDIIKNEIPDRDSFQLNSPDIIFDESLTLDLGNKVCILERMRSTHTDDSTVVYIPDEKTIFLGDSVYCTTANSLFHFKQSKLLPMIEDIQKYDAIHFILGHESICDLAEMNSYWNELISTSKAADSTSLERALESFEIDKKRKPNEDELFFLKAFVNDQILKLQ
ncbi:MBL fold metallo-hydrolase [Paenibacillus motobuensis]|uniref:MBL fold metallo-hydrolase n=1 Tax=Paenibacillus TaxID=44249 RepID=UPI00203D8385|nr:MULTISPECIES: MBL fold metallo-hydrolase [Paenibacillus]MCM3040638.1 MBL fold metallo-hydrolase [Paenibacillus lutimineralis]MCM3647742.1 MBL fold metallo-hydrolase [Paenibacillus motobuensis]